MDLHSRITKRTDCSLIHSTEWNAKFDLVDGIRRTYQDFLSESKSKTIRLDTGSNSVSDQEQNQSHRANGLLKLATFRAL